MIAHHGDKQISDAGCAHLAEGAKCLTVNPVEQQNAATGEISRAVNAATDDIAQLDNAVGIVSGSASKAGSSADEVQAGLEEVCRHLHSLQDSAHGFVADVRNSA